MFKCFRLFINKQVLNYAGFFNNLQIIVLQTYAQKLLYKTMENVFILFFRNNSDF